MSQDPVFIQRNTSGQITGWAANRQPGNSSFDTSATPWNDAALQAWVAAQGREAAAGPVVAASFAAALCGRAAALAHKGQTAAAMNLLLQAQRIDRDV